MKIAVITQRSHDSQELQVCICAVVFWLSQTELGSEWGFPVDLPLDWGAMVCAEEGTQRSLETTVILPSYEKLWVCKARYAEHIEGLQGCRPIGF